MSDGPIPPDPDALWAMLLAMCLSGEHPFVKAEGMHVAGMTTEQNGEVEALVSITGFDQNDGKRSSLHFTLSIEQVRKLSVEFQRVFDAHETYLRTGKVTHKTMDGSLETRDRKKNDD